MAGNRYYQGPPSDHFDGVRFFNPGQPGTDRSLGELLRWRLMGRRAAWPMEAARPTAKPAPRVDGVAITLVGHATVLIQVAGCNLLVDPVWSARASPVRFAGPKRGDAPGILFDDLPPIDAVLVSHNHYDHLDVTTLARLARAHGPRVITPLGNDALIPGAETGDWGARFSLAPDLHVTLHPANHWSARSLRDRRMGLWCGFVIESAAGTIYVAGDTAYGDGAAFQLVRARFGPPCVAVLPIGAYEPRWFMRNQHANPDDAVRILLDCGAEQGLGVHWGTFQLTDEPRFAPAEALADACPRHGVAPGHFRALRPGDVWTRAGP